MDCCLFNLKKRWGGHFTPPKKYCYHKLSINKHTEIFNIFQNKKYMDFFFTFYFTVALTSEPASSWDQPLFCDVLSSSVSFALTSTHQDIKSPAGHQIDAQSRSAMRPRVKSSGERQMLKP